MVNNRRNLGKWDATVPDEGDSRKIDTEQPLYSKDDLEPLLDDGKVTLWTWKCINDCADLSLDTEDVAEIAKAAINSGKYLGSEWCEGKTTGNFAACDSYVITKDWWCEAARKFLPITYYVKFAISKAGTAVLVVSCHTSKWKAQT